MLATVKKDDRLVLMGDMNGRVGRGVETWEEVIGRRHRMTMVGDFLGPVLLMA